MVGRSEKETRILKTLNKSFILQSKVGAHFEKVRRRAMCGEMFYISVFCRKARHSILHSKFASYAYAEQVAEEASKAAESEAHNTQS